MEMLLDGTRNSHLIYADWLEEYGDPHAANWRSERLATYAGFWLLDLDGLCIGIGIGRGIGIGKTLSGDQMKQGENYLIHCGDWHTFVGRYLGPSESGPLLYRFEDVVKIRETNNDDCWGELCANEGNLREACDYAFYVDGASS